MNAPQPVLASSNPPTEPPNPAPAPKEARSRSVLPRIPRPGELVPLQVFGYLIDEAWLLKFGVEHNLGTADDPRACLNTRFQALIKVMNDAESWRVSSRVYTVKTPEGDMVNCISLATNAGRHTMRTTEGDVKRFQKVLDLPSTQRPQWYKTC